MTPQTLSRATGATHLRAANFAKPLTLAMEKHGIDTPLRQAAFLGQIAHESGMFSRLTESLNYSVEGLLKTFGRHRISVEQANKYGRRPGHEADQVALANILYGGAWGAKNLGNTAPGDGAKYIGRGLKQLTGKFNYTAYMMASGVDALQRPELLTLPEHAADSAAWFWAKNELSRLADKRDWAGLTKQINGGDLGLKERIALTNNALAVLSTVA